LPGCNAYADADPWCKSDADPWCKSNTDPWRKSDAYSHRDTWEAYADTETAPNAASSPLR
jgi:hypothetical protein